MADAIGLDAVEHLYQGLSIFYSAGTADFDAFIAHIVACKTREEKEKGSCLRIPLLHFMWPLPCRQMTRHCSRQVATAELQSGALFTLHDARELYEWLWTRRIWVKMFAGCVASLQGYAASQPHAWPFSPNHLKIPERLRQRAPTVSCLRVHSTFLRPDRRTDSQEDDQEL